MSDTGSRRVTNRPQPVGSRPGLERGASGVPSGRRRATWPRFFAIRSRAPTIRKPQRSWSAIDASLPARMPAWIVQTPSVVGAPDELLEQLRAESAAARRPADVDRVLDHAAVARTRRDRRERGPAERSRPRGRRGAASRGGPRPSPPRTAPPPRTCRRRGPPRRSSRTRASPPGACSRSSQRDRTSHAQPFEEPTVVGDDDEAALERLERGLELLDRLEVEVVRRLVEHEAVDAAGGEQRQSRARALAGREARRRAADVVLAERELREQRPRVGRQQPARPRRSRRAARP